MRKDGGRARDPASEAVVATTTIASRHHTAGPDLRQPVKVEAARRAVGDGV